MSSKNYNHFVPRFVFWHFFLPPSDVRSCLFSFKSSNALFWTFSGLWNKKKFIYISKRVAQNMFLKVFIQPIYTYYQTVVVSFVNFGLFH